LDAEKGVLLVRKPANINSIFADGKSNFCSLHTDDLAMSSLLEGCRRFLLLIGLDGGSGGKVLKTEVITG
jgi:hypothetical protein